MTRLRFLVVGDVHLDVTGPLRRRTYLADLWHKLEEVRQIAVDRQVEAVVWTGDLFDRTDAKVPHWLVNQAIDYFRSFGLVRHLMAMGNHDIRGNPESWHRQPVGTVVRAGVVDSLWVEPVVVEGVVFSSPSAYREDADQGVMVALTYGLPDDVLPHMPHVRVVHTVLLPDGKSLPIPYSTPSSVWQAIVDARYRFADLYLCGHVHDDLGWFEPTGRGEPLFVNLGALARLTVLPSDLQRRVSVGLVTYEHEVFAVERVELSSMRPAGDVFDLAALAAERQQDADMTVLAAAFGQAALTDQFRLVDPVEAVDNVLNRADLDEAVKVRVRQLVASSREAVQ